MTEERKCPECGHLVGAGDRFCDNCGAEMPQNEPRPSAGKQKMDIPAFGAGSKINAMGGVSSTNVRNTRTDINTSSVDNSTNVQHNTIIVGKEETQYCEVCGNPFGEKHARCPKCGKQICFDCKVPGKNRCIECEKKALNEYRAAFQQLYFTSGGDIGIAGRQMMDQKARDLDVEKEKAAIEAEITASIPAPKSPVMPAVKQSPSSKTVQSEASDPVSGCQTQSGNNDAAKGVGTLTGTVPMAPPTQKKGGLWLGIILAVAAAAVAFFLLTKEGTTEETLPAVSSQKTEPAKTKVQEQPAPAQTTTSQSARTETASEKATSAPSPTAAPAPAKKSAETSAAKPKDTEYEAGMSAYKASDGLKALEHFKKSGSADSYYMIGLIYEKGCGSVSANAMMARKNFKTAAEKGSAEAKAKL